MHAQPVPSTPRLAKDRDVACRYLLDRSGARSVTAPPLNPVTLRAVMRLRLVVPFVLVLAATLSSVASAQDPPETPAPPAAVGDVHVVLSAEASGRPTPPDGTPGQATVSALVTCEEPVVMTAPVEIGLVFTGGAGVRNVTFEPPVLLFEWDQPVCAAGSSATLTSVVSFELWPPERYGTEVDMAVEASSENMAGAETVEWKERMGLVGTARAIAPSVVPVRTNANNEVSIRIENDANEDIIYQATVDEGFKLAEHVAYLGTGTVGTPYAPGQDGVEYLVLAFVPEEEGDAALVVRLTFEDPRPGADVLREQVVSMTISSSPDNDAAVAPRDNGAPGPGLAAVVLAVMVVAAMGRRVAGN